MSADLACPANLEVQEWNFLVALISKERLITVLLNAKFFIFCALYRIFMLSKDFIKFKSISDPQISPDGKRILFTVTTINGKKDGYNSHIWQISPKGSKPEQFTYGDKDSAPSWSPDGNTIAFLSIRDEEKSSRLFVISSHGGEARPICSMPKGMEKLAWSPDGKRILFLSSVLTEEGAEGKKSDVKVIRKLVYKLTGVGFFHDSRMHLFVVDVNGAKPRQLTHGEFDVTSASWSSDSREIAFVANMTENTDYTLIKDVWVVSSKGGNARKLTNSHWHMDAVSWSSDGKKIAFLGREIPDESFIVQKNPKIWVMSSDGGMPVNVTDSFDQWIVPFHSCILGMSEPPIWGSDSRHLYFKANEKGTLHVYQVSTDTYKVQRVTDGNMTVSSFSLSKDGSRMAFEAGDSLSLLEVWIRDEKGSRRLTDFNGSILKGAKLSSPEEFWFTASDGVKIQGWIMKPTGFKEGKKYPTILEIHGGPYAAYGYSFNHEFQVFASNGYAVVYINPRGSLGYGETFSSSETGHYGGRDYLDLMEAVDYVEKHFPFVDAGRLGVTGGSYGGYMTNWVVGHTDRFKAAIAERSISNWYSSFGASDIGAMPWECYDVGLGKYPWEALELYFEKSPISYVKNVKTPLMITVGEEDWDCTMDQAEQMYVALKKLKKEAELITFPGEHHGFSRVGKPSHRLVRFEHYLRWFNKYLQ